MIAATGYTWEYLDEFMTLPRLNALCKHWHKTPPVHITAAAFAGIQIQNPPAASAQPGAGTLTNADVKRDMPIPSQRVQWTSVRGERG